MNKRAQCQTTIEDLLRKSAPALRPPVASRVAAACERAAAAPAPSPLREPRTFTRPLLRVAACLALLLGVAALMRPRPPAAPPPQPTAAVPPSLPAVATFRDLADLMQRQELATSLASEADNLTADLVDLTAILNERTLAILF
jgi:hypothetical protein